MQASLRVRDLLIASWETDRESLARGPPGSSRSEWTGASSSRWSPSAWKEGRVGRFRCLLLPAERPHVRRWQGEPAVFFLASRVTAGGLPGACSGAPFRYGRFRVVPGAVRARPAAGCSIRYRADASPPIRGLFIRVTSSGLFENDGLREFRIAAGDRLAGERGARRAGRVPTSWSRLGCPSARRASELIYAARSSFGGSRCPCRAETGVRRVRLARAWRSRRRPADSKDTGSIPKAASTGTRRRRSSTRTRSSREEGRALAEGGPLVVDTGHHTGRSAKDKFFVREPESEDRIAWGDVNQPISEDGFDGLREKVVEHLNERDLYVVNAFAGADPAHRLAVRVVTDSPWHALFAKTLFIEPGGGAARLRARRARPPRARGRGRPGRGRHAQRDLHRPPPVARRGADRRHRVRRRDQEVDLHGHERPPAARGRLPDALLGQRRRRGPVAIFFGLSGTGKTTLSADPERRLIGDDEHGWGDEGVFNFEGGCYAKVIRLSPEPSPRSTRRRTLRHGARERRRRRARRPRPRRRLEDREHPRRLQARADRERAAGEAGGHPSSVVFLTADAFGVLPPIARLTRDQALFYFLTGLHGQARRHGDRRHGAAADVLLRCFGAPVPAAEAAGLRADARGEARRARLGRLAREHGLDGRPVRRGAADADRRDARAPPRGAGRRARRRRVPDRPDLRLRGARRGARASESSCSTRAPPGATRTPTTRRPRYLATRFKENFEKFGADENIVKAGPRV